ncbi:hypothetical protein NIE88_11900 [Sporolactobacillus shoreicorticis]|uniref:Lipoprotein n=1 Tax=Sporolactobacillus shoreicorticis TaxID=1923877 RepID=A0ABW5S2C8_9BACL|nr:hypothetical protein [Sporolactobacillus shoreicorticis]MCO7126470.1 hypothetical protein [Sporolactobacillus shoreicorticis]
MSKIITILFIFVLLLGCQNINEDKPINQAKKSKVKITIEVRYDHTKYNQYVVRILREHQDKDDGYLPMGKYFIESKTKFGLELDKGVKYTIKISPISSRDIKNLMDKKIDNSGFLNDISNKESFEITKSIVPSFKHNRLKFIIK